MPLSNSVIHDRVESMLSFTQPGQSGTQFRRREWLRIGGLAGMHWALPGLIPQRSTAADSVATQAPGFGKAKSVIVMWDPKPDAPEQIRGAFDSIALAGAGVQRGAVVGESDSRGAYPHTEAYGPWDVMATMFSSLGIDPHQHYFDPVNRPIQICDGRVMQAVYA